MAKSSGFSRHSKSYSVIWGPFFRSHTFLRGRFCSLSRALGESGHNPDGLSSPIQIQQKKDGPWHIVATRFSAHIYCRSVPILWSVHCRSVSSKFRSYVLAPCIHFANMISAHTRTRVVGEDEGGGFAFDQLTHQTRRRRKKTSKSSVKGNTIHENHLPNSIMCSYNGFFKFSCPHPTRREGRKRGVLAWEIECDLP